MPIVNLYVHVALDAPTPQVWKSFFADYLPEWQLQYKFAEEILDGSPDHIIFPGGSGSKFSQRLGEEKRNEIIKWVNDGGSYIGVCAGAYLASSHLGITPLKIPDRAWERGLHDVIIEHEGKQRTTNYHNGPIFENHPDVEVWATFKSEYLAEGGFFPMLDSPAITHNKYGSGQVTLFSPHLEKSSHEIKLELAKLFEYIDRIQKYS